VAQSIGVVLWILSQDIFRDPFVYEPRMNGYGRRPWMAYVTSANTSLSSHASLLDLAGPSILAPAARRRPATSGTLHDGEFFRLRLQMSSDGSGPPDALTILLAAFAVLYWDTVPVAALCAFLVRMNHAEQGFVILGLVSAYELLVHRSRKSVATAAATVAALLAGRVAVEVFFRAHDIPTVFGRLDFVFGAGLRRFT
jgi:hypothetical protein